jgi:hypothetical protein
MPEYDSSQTIQRLTTFFESVSDPATNRDCASVTIDTAAGRVTVEYGVFNRGDRLNITTAADGHQQRVENILDRVNRDPANTGHKGNDWVTYAVDDLSELEVAEFTLDATAGWSHCSVNQCKLRTIEPDNIFTKLLERIRA